MSSRRSSFGRVLLVTIFVVLALLLLELGRLLPGSWPGGGGDGGSRSFPTGSKPDETTLAPATSPPPPPPAAVEPGTIRVVVRHADGSPVEHGTVALGGVGAASSSLVGGEATLRIGSASPDEWSVLLPDGARVAHGRAPARGDGRWIATMPHRPADAAPKGSGTAAGAPASLQVEDADGRPIAGATITATGRAGEREAVSGSNGTALVPGVEGVERICVTAKGFGETCVYARLEVGQRRVIRLSPTRDRRTTFVDPETGAPLEARSLTLIGRRGIPKRLERDGGTFDQFDTSMPDDVAAESTLEIEVEGRPPVRAPLGTLGATTPIPAGVSRVVRMVDEKGAPVAGAVVTARFASGTAAETASTGTVETTARTDADGRATLRLPLDRDVDVVVDSPAFAAEGVRWAAHAPVDAAPLDVRASRGVDGLVTVRDEGGAPVADADVVVISPAGRATARRRAVTDASGRATLSALSSARVEVVVHRAGFEWTSKTGTAAEGGHRFDVVLRRGRRLTLVVEDAAGAPLARVAVRSVPRAAAGDAADDALDPDRPLPWETDESGVLVVDDLPDREADLYLSKPGYEEEVVARVRPGTSTWFATMLAVRAK